MSLLIVAADGPALQVQAPGLADALRQSGSLVLAVVPCHLLVREAVGLAPQAVVAIDDGRADLLLASLALLAGSLPLPVLLLGPALPPGDPASWLAARVMAWLPDTPTDAGAAARAVQAALLLALPRFAQEQAQAAALGDALARLDERKWVDRAKGLLMSHQQLNEQDAFALLRSASMTANLRVGEVSRSVIEASQAAVAVNLAGQLRMLSQRCIRSLGLLAGLPARDRSDQGLADTLQHLQRNLGRLAGLPLTAQAQAELAAVQAAGAELRARALALAAPLARGRPALLGDMPALLGDMPAQLRAADQLAEALLVAAEALAARLAMVGGRPSLRVVNLCGRQRMLSQRLAKQALLAGLLPAQDAAAQAAAAAETVREFEATLLALAQAPLTSDDIRAALAQARGQWQRLLDGLRRASGPEPQAGRSVLARESDALLAGFEQLTTLYEHSLQVLMN